MKKIIIFTDLDGTLLDAYTYSFEPAIPSLNLLKKNNIPLIICSSKTRKEIEYYRNKLDNNHPFISENGGGIYIPINYFSLENKAYNSFIASLTEKGPIDFSKNSNYYVIKIGAKYADLRKVINDLQKDGFMIKGFGDMNVENIAKLANMNIEEAEMAKQRDFDEPFIFDGSNKELKRLIKIIKAKGFNFTRGRFYHIMGNSDKGKAVSILIELYKKFFDEITTIAIGDNINDIPMFKNVEYPVLVKKPDGSYDNNINIPGIIRADGIGPEGWNKFINDLLKQLFSEK